MNVKNYRHLVATLQHEHINPFLLQLYCEHTLLKCDINQEKRAFLFV